MQRQEALATGEWWERRGWKGRWEDHNMEGLREKEETITHLIWLATVMEREGALLELRAFEAFLWPWQDRGLTEGAAMGLLR